jgi:hypothetical protein
LACDAAELGRRRGACRHEWRAAATSRLLLMPCTNASIPIAAVYIGIDRVHKTCIKLASQERYPEPRGPLGKWQDGTEVIIMMQIDAIVEDLKTRKKNLTAIKKTIADDKVKSGILDSIDKLIGRIEPLVSEKKRLEKLRNDMRKFAADVDSFNGTQRSYINSFNTLKQACKTVKEDTKTKDFEAIGKDSEMYVALNNLEKV